MGPTSNRTLGCVSQSCPTNLVIPEMSVITIYGKTAHPDSKARGPRMDSAKATLPGRGGGGVGLGSPGVEDREPVCTRQTPEVKRGKWYSSTLWGQTPRTLCWNAIPGHPPWLHWSSQRRTDSKEASGPEAWENLPTPSSRLWTHGEEPSRRLSAGPFCVCVWAEILLLV